jgi:hypothetical protein
MNEKKTLSEVLYDDELGQYDLESITSEKISYNLPDEPEKWTYIRARAGDRGVPIKSTGIHVVLETKSHKSLIEELERKFDSDTSHYKLSQCVEAMPRRMRRNKVQPSVRGEYLTIKEVRGREKEDGRIEVVKSSGFSSKIPVEYVIEPLTYNKVVSELIDDYI